MPGSSGTPVSTLSASGSLDDRLARVESRLEFLSDYTVLPIMFDINNVTATTPPFIVGAVTIPWGILRPKLQIPDDRWDAWLTGYSSNAGGSTTIGLYYYKDDASTVLLGSSTVSAGNPKKLALGPFPARGAYFRATGAPQTEQIPGFALSVTVSAGSANMSWWTLWLRQSPTRS